MLYLLWQLRFYLIRGLLLPVKVEREGRETILSASDSVVSVLNKLGGYFSFAAAMMITFLLKASPAVSICLNLSAVFMAISPLVLKAIYSNYHLSIPTFC
jgi:hypothetical protein